MMEVKVVDQIHHAAQAQPRPSCLQSLLWIHRIGNTIGTNVAEVSRFFVHGEGARYTGGTMAYHYLVSMDYVEQALPLDEQGAHARRWGNAHGIGIAVFGDFRFDRPTSGHWAQAVSLCADLVPILSRHSTRVLSLLPTNLRHSVPVIGHGEVRFAYASHSDKVQPHGKYACPGRYWDMGEFRSDVEREMARRAVLRCTKLGHRLSR